MSGQNVNVCDIGDDVKEVLKKFRFQKHTTNAALILKVCKDSSSILYSLFNSIRGLISSALNFKLEQGRGTRRSFINHV